MKLIRHLSMRNPQGALYRRKQQQRKAREAFRLRAMKAIYPPQQGNRSARWSSALAWEWSEQHGV